MFLPQEGLPDGDVHEDWTVFSFDSARETWVLRQFNSEGYVNTFVLDAASAPPERLVFVLEASENAPGAQATLTLTRTAPDAFEEVFEVKLPAWEEAVTIRGSWRRSVP